MSDQPKRRRRREKVKSGLGISSPVFNGPCKGMTDLFYRVFTTTKESQVLRLQLKAICGRCDDFKPCRAWAIKHEEFGFWGGMTEQERRAYRINHNIVLERPEALTVDPKQMGIRATNKMTNYLNAQEEEDEWL